MKDAFVHTFAQMGTVVAMQIVGHGASERARRERKRGVDRAVAWFERIEAVCSRFDAQSELRQLSTRVGQPVPVSPLLFEAVQFALAVAYETQGAFDPTVGHRMEARGFNVEYRSGDVVQSHVDAPPDVSYRDVELDVRTHTITLHRPVLFDLGAVAKGLALDMAARELSPLINFAIDAGGDLFLGGHNFDGAEWTVGIRHPRDVTQMFETVHVSDHAVCTSGDYVRHVHGMPTVHHIMQPRTGVSTTALASVTVIATSAMVADAFATAAFVLGPIDGLALLHRHELRGMMVTPTLERIATTGFNHA